MTQLSRIRTLMTKTNCTYDQALEADEKANGNIDEAISIIQNEVYVGNGQAVASAPDCDNDNYSGNKYNNESTNSIYNNKYRNTNKYRNSENTNKYNSGNSNNNNNNKYNNNNNNYNQQQLNNEITSYKNGLLVNNKFYPYKDKTNLRLKKMLENNEFDANILQSNDSQAEVVYKDKEDEEYQEPVRQKSFDNCEKHVLKFDKSVSSRSINGGGNRDCIAINGGGNIENRYMNDGSRYMNDRSTNLDGGNIENRCINENRYMNDGNINYKQSPLNITCPNEFLIDETGTIKFKVLIDHQRVTVLMNSEMTVKDFYMYISKYTNKKVLLVRDGEVVNENDCVTKLKQKMYKLVEEDK